MGRRQSYYFLILFSQSSSLNMNEVFDVAAVIGRDFPFSDMQESWVGGKRSGISN